MSIKEEHLKEVLKIKKRYDSYKYNVLDIVFIIDLEIEYAPIGKGCFVDYCKNDVDYQRIIFAYFVTDTRYYYLEKMHDYYILTKRISNTEIKVLLSEKNSGLIKNENSFHNFKKYCICMDYEKNLFSN